MVGCWQIVAIYFYLLLLYCSRTPQQVCRASVCEMEVLSSPNIWCHRHFMMEKIACSGSGNGNVFHSVLSTVSLFPIHQSRYLILRHSSAVFHPFHASYKNTCLWPNMCFGLNVNLFLESCFSPVAMYQLTQPNFNT